MDLEDFSKEFVSGVEQGYGAPVIQKAARPSFVQKDNQAISNSWRQTSSCGGFSDHAKVVGADYRPHVFEEFGYDAVRRGDFCGSMCMET